MLALFAPTDRIDRAAIGVLQGDAAGASEAAQVVRGMAGAEEQAAVDVDRRGAVLQAVGVVDSQCAAVDRRRLRCRCSGC